MHTGTATRSTLAVAAVSLLALTGCASADEDTQSQEAAPATQSATQPSESVDPAEETPEDALELFDSPGAGSVIGPNGEAWDLVGTYDPETLRDHRSGTKYSDTTTISCNYQDLVQYVWLTAEAEEPACFGEEGGHDNNREARSVRYVCQAPNTTARTLIIPLDEGGGGDTVWTPEHTTGDTWECLDFAGEDVEGVQMEFLNASA